MRSWTLFLDSLLLSLPFPLRIILILLVMGVSALIAWKMRFLTKSGILAAAVLGFIVMYLGSVSGLVLFLFFFLSSSAISRIIHPDKERKGRRLAQVVANGAPAAIALHSLHPVGLQRRQRRRNHRRYAYHRRKLPKHFG